MTGTVRRPSAPRTDVAWVADALAVEGGHLFIGGGGFVLHHAAGATLRGCGLAAMKALCAEAGLPVIDILYGEHRLALPMPRTPPMVAVGRPPDPEPWGPSSYAPLRHVAGLYRAAGAEVLNVPGDARGSRSRTWPTPAEAFASTQVSGAQEAPDAVRRADAKARAADFAVSP